MNWYDRDWNRWFGPPAGRRGRYEEGGYGPQRGGGRGSMGGGGPWGASFGAPRQGGPYRYDRGIYGGSYPTFGGIPGGGRRGMYYGGGYGGQGGGRSPGRGQGGWVYDDEFATEPFLPESAYRRHPAYERPPRSQGWTGVGSNQLFEVGMEDDEIRQAVRENLYQDSHLDADRIEVDVNGGVVTLTGEVDDYLEARYAWDDTWDTPGVRGVVNHLAVRTDLPADENETVPQSAGGEGEGAETSNS
jgi:hypothetical protein